ncbi:helix-turn-helix domain-containing protein [Candidatus Marsarchaeota archaeon]|nr:helix-turn-helix domain-containing protein [Candidatus Marsarchaeota archaeon]
MGKHGDTKQRILELIARGKNNLGEISKDLGLSQSTVSQHLQDLKRAGKIVQKENNHIKKWKYYSIASDGLTNHMEVNKNHRGWKYWFVVPIIAALSIVLVMSILFNTSSDGTFYIPISITDPPQVPVGTQALYVNYSALNLLLNTTNGPAWVNVNSSGRLNLMSIINTSQIIGEIGIKPDSSVYAAKFIITSASMEINNVTYNVELTSGNLIANVENSGRLNSSSGLLLDLYPIVVPTETQNATKFIMLPSLRFIAYKNPELYVGSNIDLHNPHYIIMYKRYPLHGDYNMIFENQTTAIRIVNSSVNQKDNVTSIYLKILNREGAKTTIFGVILYGEDLSGKMPGNESDGNIWTKQANGSVVINASELCGDNAFRSGNIIIKPNYSVKEIIISHSGNAFYSCMENQGIITQPEPISFGIETNGTMEEVPLLFLIRGRQGSGSIGYSLAAHSSAVFTFNGTIYDAGERPIMAHNITAYNMILITNRGTISTRINSS